MGHIFSFVGGTIKKDLLPISKRRSKSRRKQARCKLPGPGSYWSVKEAANLCSILASVSPTWKSAVDTSIESVISVPLDVNLDDFPSEEAARYWLSWLSLHKPCIGKLRSRRQWPALTKELMVLLRACDTSRLEQIELFLSSEQDEMQAVIAQQCPNLQSLSIFVAAEEATTLSGSLSEALLSLPSVEALEVCLISPKTDLSERDGMTLNQLVQNLPGITPLDEGTLDILSLRHPKELRYEPFAASNPRKCALGLATVDSFRSPTFGFP